MPNETAIDAIAPKTGRIAILAGMLWALVSIVSLLADNPQRSIDALMVAPVTATLFAFIGLNRLQREHFGRFGRISAFLSFASLIFLLPCQTILTFDIERVAWLAFPVGAMLWLLGFLLYGIATLRAKTLSPWIGLGILVSEPLAAVLGIIFSPISPLADHGDYSGALAHGLVWFTIGVILTSMEREATVELPGNALIPTA